MAASRRVSLRFSAHNGRRFVGAAAESDAWIVDAGAGAESGLEPSIALAADVVLEDVPQDELVVVVVEVLYRATGDAAEAPKCLGWGFASPFRRASAESGAANARAADVFVAPDGRAAFGGGLDVREGPTEVRIRRARGPRSEPCVDWRAATRAPPEVWRALAGAARSDEGAFAVAFDAARAEGDVPPEELAANAARAARVARATPTEEASAGIERRTNQRPAGEATVPAPTRPVDPPAPSRPVDPPVPPRPVPVPVPASGASSDVRARAQMDALASKMEAQMNRMEEMPSARSVRLWRPRRRRAIPTNRPPRRARRTFVRSRRRRGPRTVPRRYPATPRACCSAAARRTLANPRRVRATRLLPVWAVFLERRARGYTRRARTRRFRPTFVSRFARARRRDARVATVRLPRRSISTGNCRTRAR